MRSKRSSLEQTEQRSHPWTDSTESKHVVEERSRGQPWCLAVPTAPMWHQRSSYAPSAPDMCLGQSACHWNVCPPLLRSARGITVTPLLIMIQALLSWTLSLKLYRRYQRQKRLAKAAHPGLAPTTSLLSLTRRLCRGEHGTGNTSTMMLHPELL